MLPSKANFKSRIKNIEAKVVMWVIAEEVILRANNSEN